MMPYSRAVTFGQKYRHEQHPRLGDAAHPDGYIVVTAPDEPAWWLFMRDIVGEVDEVTLEYAFDYDIEEFEAPGGTADRYHYRGRLAEFSKES